MIYTKRKKPMRCLLKPGCLLPLIAFLLTGGGCSDETGRSAKDAQIRQALFGTWLMQTNRIDGVMTFHADGSFSGYWSNTVASKGWRYDGQWWITNGECVTIITNKAAWNYTLHDPTGTEERLRVLRLGDRELIAASGDQTNKWIRKQ